MRGRDPAERLGGALLLLRVGLTLTALNVSIVAVDALGEDAG